MAQPSDMIVFNESHRPSADRSVIRKWADMLTLGSVTPALRSAERQFGVGHVAAAVHSLRASGESAAAGALLGAVSATGGLDRDGIPVDLASGLGSIAAGVVMSHHEIGQTLRTAGAAAVGIFAFRKTEEWLGVRKAAIHGEARDQWSDLSMNTDHTVADERVGFVNAGEEDPIVAAAKAM